MDQLPLKKIPIFYNILAETQFDQECASSNPLTPASQSGFWRILFFRGRNARKQRASQAFEVSTETGLRHLSPAQLKAFKLADNKLAQNAHWDERLLGEAFVGLKALDLDFDLEITGFALPEIDLLIQNLDQSPFPEEEQGSITGVPVCKVGDLWLAGDHRILCGDSTSDESFQRLMQDALARLVFIDPPFNVAIQGHVSGNGKVRHREFAHASGEMNTA